MLSNKPYLIRASFEWILDNQCTPVLVVNALFPNVQAPQNFIEDDQISLNISPEAVRDLVLGNDLIEFRASFSGVAHFISVPVKAVIAIYAYENEEGMFFDFEDEETTDESPITTPEKKKKRPAHLKLVE